MLFIPIQERQKELETYNIYSERFLRGQANRRTGKHNRDAFNRVFRMWSINVVFYDLVSCRKPKKPNGTNRSVCESATS